jgi:peroxiredoxin
MGPDGIRKSLRARCSAARRSLFAVPGAFTPTCHLKTSRFHRSADESKKNGVDTVVCVAVNDPFVFGAAEKSGGKGKVLFLSDGNAEFTKKIGMDDERAASAPLKRYAALVEDGVVKALNDRSASRWRALPQDPRASVAVRCRLAGSAARGGTAPCRRASSSARCSRHGRHGL